MRFFKRRPQRRQYATDDEACHGADGLEKAVNWLQHVITRDFDGAPVERCIIVAEIGEGRKSQVLYTTHSPYTPSVEIRGLLSEGLRALEEIRERHVREIDIARFVNAAVPLIVERLRESEVPPTPEELARVVSGLARKQQDPRDPGQP